MEGSMTDLLEGKQATYESEVLSKVRMFEEAEQSTWEERILNERDRDYYDGKQLTDDEIAALKKRGQPPVKYNRIRRKVNFLLGLERQSRKDPKCFPRNPDDEEAAQAATDALRYVCDVEQWDAKRSGVWEEILVEGTGAIFVGAKRTAKGVDPEIIHVPWDRFFYDPHSRRHDFSDAGYMGIVTWVDYEEALVDYPDASEVLMSTYRSASESQTYDDRPRWHRWVDTNRKRVRIIELYHKERGVWVRCLFTELGYIEEPQPSPYQDGDGMPDNPLKAVSLYVDRDNNRYGDVRDMIDPQDEINKRRSKGLHLITMRQARISPAANTEPARVRRELAKPDGVIEAEAGDIEILDHNDQAAQNLNLLQEAKSEIDLIGANAALQGKNENDMSGRAILAQQQGGMVEVALHMDRLRHLTLQVYEAIWNRIRQFWQGERWVRVTDDRRNMRFVGLNQPVTASEMMQERIKNDPQAQQALQAPQAQQRLAMFLQSPQAQMVVGMRNVPAEIDVDIIIDEGMDTPTVQSEQWQELVKMLPAFGPLGQHPKVLQMIVEASQLRDKDKLIDLIEQANQQDPMADMMKQLQAVLAQLEAAQKQADVEKTKSETVENYVNAEAKQASTEIEAFKAGASAG